MLVWVGHSCPTAVDVDLVFDLPSIGKAHVGTAAWAVQRAQSGKYQRKGPATSGAFFRFSLPNLNPLSRSRLHIPSRISLELSPAFLRAEKIFPARKLRLEFGLLLLIHRHSTNRIRSHD